MIHDTEWSPGLVCWALSGSFLPAMCNQTSCAQVHELLKGHCGDNQEVNIVFMITHILYPSCFCEIWALCVSWITYDHLYFAPSLACWSLSGSLVPATVYHVPNCMSCQKAIVVITRTVPSFHDYIYIRIHFKKDTFHRTTLQACTINQTK